MILKYNYWQFQSILPKEVCENIIKFAKEKKQKKGKVGMNNKLKPNFAKRDSNVVWLKEDWIYKTVLPYLDIANKNAGWNFQTNIAESAQFTIYKKGQYYNWHSDCGIKLDKDGQIRKLSASIILNDPSEFEGGELEFCHYTKPNEKIILSTEKQLTTAGSMAVFPSFIFHRVKPVTKGVRYSLVVWLRGFPLK